MAEKILVRKIEPNLWQWRLVTAQNQWQSDAFYTGDINLLAESVAGKTCWLLLDGRNVGTRSVDVGVKDRRLLAKLVPFEIEESVVTPIDDVVIAYGALVDGVVDIAYSQAEHATDLIAELESIGAVVQSLSCDFLELDRREGWLLLLDEGNLYVKTGAIQGFKCEAASAKFFLQALFDGDAPAALHLVAADQDSLILLRSWLPEAVDSREDLVVYEQEGGVWDLIVPKPKPVADFRTGGLARQLPFGQWWATWKIPAIAASVAFVLALGATWGELRHAKTINRQLFDERNTVFRQVVPGGSIADPVRQLEGKLNRADPVEPSNLVALVAKVAPQIRSNPDLKVTAFRYTQNNGNLQVNLEAKDFASLEALRGKIIEQGLVADIKRSSVSGEIHLAQMIVTEG